MYARGAEYLDRYNKNDPKSMLLEHCNFAHEGRRMMFKMDVTGTYHRDSTKRQISEGIMIEKNETNELKKRVEHPKYATVSCTMPQRMII